MEIDYKKEALKLADFDTDAGKLINIFMHNWLHINDNLTQIDRYAVPAGKTTSQEVIPLIEADKDREELDMGVRYDIYISITHFSFFTKVETGLLMYPMMEDDRAHTGMAEVYGGTMAIKKNQVYHWNIKRFPLTTVTKVDAG